MSNVSIVLPERGNLSEKEYVEQRLVPMAAELHKVMNEFFTPGVSDEEHSVDMTTSDNCKFFTDVNQRVEKDKSKSVKFECPNDIPLFKGDKRLKILLAAVVYVLPVGSDSVSAKMSARGFSSKSPPTAGFQLVRSCDGSVVEDSIFQVMEDKPTLYQRYLPFGKEEKTKGSAAGSTNVCRISPFEYDYHMQARSMNVKCVPVVRRISLSTVYI
jgi:hypothetical protein